jgi:putative phosphoribosyl transferase
MMFQNRRHAGRVLARDIEQIGRLRESVVLAVPRGGVPVAYELAVAHGLPLDVLVVRKLGVPGQEELAMGAIAEGAATVINPDIIDAFRISQKVVDAIGEQEMHEVERQQHTYRGGHPPTEIQGQAVILVDDGLATGATMRAAIRAIRSRAGRVIVAVPVGARSTCRQLQSEADLIVCTYAYESFGAVGKFYQDFQPTTDGEVKELLAAARHLRAAPPAA